MKSVQCSNDGSRISRRSSAVPNDATQADAVELSMYMMATYTSGTSAAKHPLI